MLLNLSLNNFVIVDHLDCAFEAGFTALTGETGAGKSIILDALGLLLGDKADATRVRHGCKEANLSALFSIERLPLVQAMLDEMGFLEDDQLILRRVISSEGKSRNFINGQSCTVAQLKQVGEMLIDIHGQNAHFSLHSESNHRAILDSFGQLSATVDAVKSAYQIWQQAQQILDEAQKNAQESQWELERLHLKRAELENLAPQIGEWETLSQNYDILAHAADLREAADSGQNKIDGDKGMQSLLFKLRREVSAVAHIDARFGEVLALCDSMEAELEETASLLRQISVSTDVNPHELQRHDARMREYSALARRFQIDESALPTLLDSVREQIEQLNQTRDLESLQEAVEKHKQHYNQQADQLTQMRQRLAPVFAREVMDLLQGLSMENAQFEVQLIETAPSSSGKEKIQFCIAVNSGSVIRPIHKVASGGELARISLAIQVASGSHTSIPTLIFDEADSGIGGRVAEVVGMRLRDLGAHYQVLAITHLAQVAVAAHQHWQVSKREENGVTLSRICALNQSERLEEIARMIGGQTITEATREHAREMLKGYL